MRSKIPVGTAVLALLAVAAMAAGAARQVYNFGGGVKTRADKGITRAELRPAPGVGNFFTWCYTFIIYLDDDSSATIQMTYWKFYLLSQRGALFSFIDKGEKKYYQQRLFDEEEVSFRDDPPEMKMGPNYWRGFYPDFYIHMDFPPDEDRPGMKADLHLRCRTPGWRPGEGPVHYGSPEGDFYDLIVVIPWADLEGTVTIDGKTRKVKGWGYSDHNTQNVFPTSQVEKILALRSFSDQYSINFLEYIAPEDYGNARSTWILIMKDNRILYATDQWERELSDLEAEPRRGYRYPTRVTISIDQPDCRLRGELLTGNRIEALDAMDELPSFIRTMAEKFVQAPVFIRLNAVVKWHLVMPQEGIDVEFTNKGVFETTIVR